MTSGLIVHQSPSHQTLLVVIKQYLGSTIPNDECWSPLMLNTWLGISNAHLYSFIKSKSMVPSTAMSATTIGERYYLELSRIFATIFPNNLKDLYSVVIISCLTFYSKCSMRLLTMSKALSEKRVTVASESILISDPAMQTTAYIQASLGCCANWCSTRCFGAKVASSSRFPFFCLMDNVNLCTLHRDNYNILLFLVSSFAFFHSVMVALNNQTFSLLVFLI